jgi:CHAT domain-containing protein
LLPLHALTFNEDDENCLLNYVNKHFSTRVSYAPSGQIWYKIQNRQYSNFNHLFAVQNPTLDLEYADLEVKVIKQFFQSADIFREDAKKENINNSLINADCIHFSCHGFFNFDEPLTSALILAESKISEPKQLTNTEYIISLKEGDFFDLKKCLKLEEIFNLNLTQNPLVILSACETGLTDPKSISDEYIGLPSGFLYAGVPSVISSLWTVDEISTAFLMISFYQKLFAQEGAKNVIVAMNEAQLWLRDITKAELEQWIEILPLDPVLMEHVLRLEYLQNLEDNAKPFANPYYWAAFCAIGQ